MFQFSVVMDKEYGIWTIHGCHMTRPAKHTAKTGNL